MASADEINVPVSFVLKPEHRTPESAAELRRVLTEIGFAPGSGGLATVTARIDAKGFARVFGFPITPVPPKKPSPGRAKGAGLRSAGDYGSAGGFEAQREVTVPKVVEHLVSSTSVQPPPKRLA